MNAMDRGKKHSFLKMEQEKKLFLHRWELASRLFAVAKRKRKRRRIVNHLNVNDQRYMRFEEEDV